MDGDEYARRIPVGCWIWASALVALAVIVTVLWFAHPDMGWIFNLLRQID